MLAVTGGGRTRQRAEREEADGKLMCRLSDQVSHGHAGLLPSDRAADHARHVGAVPDEVLDLAREALAEDPYLSAWRRSPRPADGFDPAR